jgi:integrase
MLFISNNSRFWRRTKGTFGTPKTRASRREPPLAPAVVQALQAHHIRSRNSADNALVFVARQGTPLDAKNLRRCQLHSASQRAGLGLIDWHSLRHTHGTLLHEQGTPLRVAQAQLGHSHTTTTVQICTHASGSAQRQAVVHLESLWFPSVPKFAAANGRISKSL